MHSSIGVTGEQKAYPLPKLGSWSRDLAAGQVLVCPTGASLFGFETEAVASGLPLHAFMDRIHKDDRGSVTDAAQRGVEGHKYDVVYRVQSEAGIRLLRARGGVMKDRHGAPVRFAGILMELETSSLGPTSPMDEIVDCFLRAHEIATQWGFGELTDHCSSGLTMAILRSIRS